MKYALTVKCDVTVKLDTGLYENYLLVKKCPEHGKGNVEEENLEHHFDLGDEKFLSQQEERYEIGYELNRGIYTILL